MPAQDRLGLHQEHRSAPSAGDCARDHDDGAVERGEARALDLSPEDQQLLTKEHVFGKQKSAWPEQIGNHAKDRSGGSGGIAKCSAGAAQRAPGRRSHEAQQALQHASSMAALRRRNKLVIPQNLRDPAPDRDVAGRDHRRETIASRPREPRANGNFLRTGEGALADSNPVAGSPAQAPRWSRSTSRRSPRPTSRSARITGASGQKSEV
jgi:hypothetical protein